MLRLKWKVTIEEVDKGFIVQVGCKRIATDMTWGMLIKILNELRENPGEKYKTWFPEDFDEMGNLTPQPCDPQS